jgi:hypothetical protein
MKANEDLGFVFPIMLCVLGTYAVLQSTEYNDWYMDSVLVAGATVLTIGLVTLGWSARHYLSVKGVEHHVRDHK